MLVCSSMLAVNVTMKNKISKITACCLAILLFLISLLPVSAETGNRNSSKAQSFINDIINYKMSESGVSSVQQWINGSLTNNAGSTSEWYTIALSQYGKYDFFAYKKALTKYLNENEVYSASSRQKYALALIATGSTDKYIHNTLNDSIGQQGVMSWVFGLHLFNNGYSSNDYSLSVVKQKLLSLQLNDGGWAVMGTNGDVDVTAMAVQALAPYYYSDSSVRNAVDKALAMLSARQQSSGDYASYGVNNPESTTQVLVALSSLGIDCKSDSRFIKGGNTLLDVIGNYQLSNGAFSHKQGGGFNETATMQVLYSMVAYSRMQNGKTSLYILDNRNPSGLNVSDSANSNEQKNDINKQSNSSSKTDDKTSSDTQTDSDDKLSNKADKQTDSSSSKSDSKEKETTSTHAKSEYTEEIVAENRSEASDNLSATPSESKKASTPKNNSQLRYKLWVSLAIVFIATGACVVLYVTKKRNKKNFIVVVAVAVVVICIVLITDFQATDSYYENTDLKENAVGTVTLTIRCDTIAEKGEREYIPEDGIILDTTEFEIEDGETVHDILTEASSKYEIHLETTGDADAIYVEGINHIYEFDFGDLSGWVYHVNGTEPSVGSGEYELSDGDTVEWFYTCELGEDLK